MILFYILYLSFLCRIIYFQAVLPITYHSVYKSYLFHSENTYGKSVYGRNVVDIYAIDLTRRFIFDISDERPRRNNTFI